MTCLFWSDRAKRVETKLKVMSTVSKEERQRARFQEREKDKEELRGNFLKFRYWQEKCDIFVSLWLKVVNYWDKPFPGSNTLEYKNTESILRATFNWRERLKAVSLKAVIYSKLSQCPRVSQFQYVMPLPSVSGNDRIFAFHCAAKFI